LEIRPHLTPDPRGFLFHVSDFSRKSYISRATALRKLVFGLKGAESMISYMCLIHLYGLNAIEIEI